MAHALGGSAGIRSAMKNTRRPASVPVKPFDTRHSWSLIACIDVDTHRIDNLTHVSGPKPSIAIRYIRDVHTPNLILQHEDLNLVTEKTGLNSSTKRHRLERRENCRISLGRPNCAVFGISPPVDSSGPDPLRVSRDMIVVYPPVGSPVTIPGER